MVIKVHLASSWTKSNHISCTYTVMNGNHNWTGRPSPLWSDGSRQVILTDFCEDSCGVVPAIADPVAEWPATVAEALLNLGLSCTEIGRKGVKWRPSVADCIINIVAMVMLPPSPPSVWQKECVVCLESRRGENCFIHRRRVSLDKRFFCDSCEVATENCMVLGQVNQPTNHNRSC